MSEQVKILVPRLRFPEFLNEEGWEQKKLKDLFEIGSGKDYKHLSTGDIPVYGSGGYMLSVDDFLYDGESVCIGRKGTIDKPMLLNGKFWTVDTLFYTHSFKDCSPKFIFSIFQNIDWLKHNEAGGVPSLSKTTINEIPTYIPKPKEQQKIADCLSSLDDLITAQNQKVEALKQHKKGLMQQLFPAEGETVPKFRFPEFESDGSWKPKTLSEIVIPVVREVSKPEANYLALGIRSHGKGTFHKPDQAPEKNSMDKLYLVNKGDLIVNITFAWEGAIAIAKGEDHGTYVSHRFPTYVFNEKISSSNFFQYLIINKSFIYKLGLISPGGAGRNRVMNKNDFLKITVLLPSPNEQEKIGKCLSSLDEAISTQAEKLKALKAHKKGVMQQLFPSVNEVSK